MPAPPERQECPPTTRPTRVPDDACLSYNASVTSSVPPKTGIVYLVGAGPGDPGLLTLRGAELLSRADVVVYDYLANPQLLSHCKANVEKIYVGKKAASHSMTQEQINAL